jgi:hypothetical protein
MNPWSAQMIVGRKGEQQAPACIRALFFKALDAAD